MTDTITLTGVVATTPRSLRTAEGLAITSFRLASAQRRRDRATGTWSDGETNWYTVTCFRALAENAAVSVGKGERVVVSGRLRVRPWESGEKSGTSVEVDADAVGHDLAWGRSTFTRVLTSTTASGTGPGPVGAAPGPTDDGTATEGEAVPAGGPDGRADLPGGEPAAATDADAWAPSPDAVPAVF